MFTFTRQWWVCMCVCGFCLFKISSVSSDDLDYCNSFCDGFVWFSSIFIIFMTNLLADMLLGKYLAYFLKTICILGCDFCSNIHPRTSQIFNIHCTIFPIRWISIDAVSKSENEKRQKNVRLNSILFILKFAVC